MRPVVVHLDGTLDTRPDLIEEIARRLFPGDYEMMNQNDPETLAAARQGAGLPPAGPLPPVSLQELLGQKVYLADGREVGEVQDYGHTSEEVVVRLRGAK